MKIYSLSDDIPRDRYAIALGNFDGVHTAHSALIESAKKFGGRCAVFTFSKLSPPYITNEQKRLEAFEALGVDDLFLCDFDSVKNMTGEQFFREILVGKIGLSAAFCGFNFTFGKGALCKARDLEALCRAESIPCFILPQMSLSGETVSSSAVRSYLASGRIEQANAMLGRRYSIDGSVIHGKALASKLGFPTINTLLDPSAVSLLYGVYFTLCRIDGKDHPAITNVGVRPTFDDKTPTAETYLLSESIDLYGKDITLSFCSFCRPETRFESVEALAVQVAADVERAKEYFKK